MNVTLPLWGPTAVQASSTWTAAVGPLHPVLLHLPIGFLAATALAECVEWRAARARPASEPPRCAPVLQWLYVATGASAVAAASAGWCLAESKALASALAERHARDAFVLTGVAVAGGLLSVWSTQRWARWAQRGLLGLGLGLVGLVGHQGGTLTHGRGALTEHAPAWAATVGAWLDAVALPPVGVVPDDGASDDETPVVGTGAAAQAVVLVDRFCVKCHGPDKQEGDLRLDGVDRVRAQVEPGHALLSPLIEQMLLAPSDGDAMPPESEAQPTPAEIGALIDWIRKGAPR